ncbi:hypothetical protein BV25DRAFT_1309107 [Artomyces pyxidatus]|uniref:Uncharacterized protein n=1 Tax=Artomyces pyxidatus TaxID=48021 RepID=A0ACB8SNJ9_9AGAM|nr:hypothetical protein BV25DRAFT_1309107 [Artomyces pyxidatus]
MHIVGWWRFRHRRCNRNVNPYPGFSRPVRERQLILVDHLKNRNPQPYRQADSDPWRQSSGNLQYITAHRTPFTSSVRRAAIFGRIFVLCHRTVSPCRPTTASVQGTVEGRPIQISSSLIELHACARSSSQRTRSYNPSTTLHTLNSEHLLPQASN